MSAKERILKKLKDCHEQENELNKNLSKIDTEIDRLTKQKFKISKSISKNMKYRNLLISQL